MSSILKALEKVEEAQNRRSGGAGGFVKARERRPAWVLPVAVLSGAVVAGLGTFAAMGGFSKHAAQAPQAAVVAQAGPVALQPAQLQQQAAPAPQAKQAQAVAVPAQKALKPAVPSVAAKAKAQPAKAVAAAKAKAGKTEKKSERKVAKSEQKRRSSEHRSAARSRAEREARVHSAPVAPTPAAPVKAVAPPAVAPVPVAHAAEKAHPAIKVTGIAWQKDSVSSVAMVNGRSVQQGATVDGYKVEQIFEDKVRFSGSNGKLEVPLGAGQ